MVNAELGTTWWKNKMNIFAMKHALMIKKIINDKIYLTEAKLKKVFSGNFVTIVPLLFPTVFGKRGIFTLSPYRGYFFPSHFHIIIVIYLVLLP